MSPAHPSQVDTLIKAKWIIPVVPHNTVLEDCAITIHDGKINAIVPQAEADKQFLAKQSLNLDRHIVIPGLINSHGHAAMSLLRGYADDVPLQEWLEQHIWPAEGRFVDRDFVHAGVQLAMAEMIRAGTTCFTDMYFFPDVAAACAQQAGMRAQINAPILDFPTVWAQHADEYIDKALVVHDDFRSSELVSVGFGPHAPYTVSDAPFKRLAVLSAELQVVIHIHLHESAFEVERAIKEAGKRPIQRLHELNVLTPLTHCVHMTQVDDSDIALLKQTGAHVIHCPESNMKLASGFCPVAKLLDAGVNLALGTDGAASNNDLDLFGEMRTAALLAKAVAQDATAVNAHQALRMATLNAATAFGKESVIGSLEVGKHADITAIAVNDIETTPLFDAASHCVYTNNAHRVSHVWVQGKPLLQDRQLLTLNEKEILQQARQWREKMANR
jgi:5-methylthioadenosine/S-adenosylhomocysteine deaminase